MSPLDFSISTFSIADCDWKCYLHRYPELVEAFGSQDVKSAKKHWTNFGKQEGRDCTCGKYIFPNRAKNSKKLILVGNAYFLQIIVAIYEFKIEPGGIGDPCTVWWECASDVCQNGHCIGRF